MLSKSFIIFVAGVSILLFSGCYTSFAALQTVPANRTAYVIEEFDSGESSTIYIFSTWYDYVPIPYEYTRPIIRYYDPIVQFYYDRSYWDWSISFDPWFVSWRYSSWYADWHFWEWGYHPYWRGRPKSFYASSWYHWDDSYHGYTGVYLPDDNYSKRPFTHRDAIPQTSQRLISGRSQINIARNTNTAEQQTSQQPRLEKTSQNKHIVRIERNDANQNKNSGTGSRGTIRPASSGSEAINQENAKQSSTKSQSRPSQRIQTIIPKSVSSSRTQGAISTSRSKVESNTITTSPSLQSNQTISRNVETRNQNSSSVVKLNSNTVIRIEKPNAAPMGSNDSRRSNTISNYSNNTSASSSIQTNRSKLESQKRTPVQSRSRTLSKPEVTTRQAPPSVEMSRSSQSSGSSVNSQSSSGSLSRSVISNRSQVQSARSESQSKPQPESSSRSATTNSQSRRQRR